MEEKKRKKKGRRKERRRERRKRVNEVKQTGDSKSGGDNAEHDVVRLHEGATSPTAMLALLAGGHAVLGHIPTED